jgi:hypothetical protein
MCALVVALIRTSMQQPPNLLTTSVYPFAPFFVTQPSNVTAAGEVVYTPSGAYAFAYQQDSRSAINQIVLPCSAQSNPSLQ